MKKALALITVESKVVLAYLVFLILNEIIISGGKYPYDIYTVIFNIITILVILCVFRNKYYETNTIITRIKEGLRYSVTFAVLDFLIVYLLLYKSNPSLYGSYSTYVYYGLLLIVPIISIYIMPIVNLVKSRCCKQIPLDKPQTNHIIR